MSVICHSVTLCADKQNKLVIIKSNSTIEEMQTKKIQEDEKCSQNSFGWYNKSEPDTNIHFRFPT